MLTRRKYILLSPGFGAVFQDDDCCSCRAHQILWDAGLGRALLFFATLIRTPAGVDTPPSPPPPPPLHERNLLTTFGTNRDTTRGSPAHCQGTAVTQMSVSCRTPPRLKDVTNPPVGVGGSSYKSRPRSVYRHIVPRRRTSRWEDVARPVIVIQPVTE